MKQKISFKEFVDLVMSLCNPGEKSLMRVKMIDFYTNELFLLDIYTTWPGNRLNICKDDKKLFSTPLEKVELYEIINVLSLHLKCDYHNTYYLTVFN